MKSPSLRTCAGPAVPISARSPRTAVLVAVLALFATLFALPQQAFAATGHATTRYEGYLETRLLGLINSERHAHHLPSVTMDWNLRRSARGHDSAMAHDHMMSHQLPGEAYFATRISRAGYRWHYAGENIGWNSRMDSTGVLALETAMYNEKAPYDGHRLNILSSHYRNVGVDVYLDPAHHKIWLTTDYGQH